MARHIRSAVVVAIVATVALFALLPVAGAAPRGAETKTVTVKNFEFAPAALTINVGDTVMWHNDGPSAHTATAEDGSFNSGTLSAGKEFSFAFAKAGKFSYVCKFHDTMQGVITVQEADSGATGGDAQPTAQPANPQPTAEEPDAVEVDNQPISNGSITVGEIYAGQDGWIVAHLDEGGAPGKVLGQTQVKKGESNNVVIKLSENVPVGGKLWPMLHIDAGAAGTYEFPGPDAPVKDAAGMVVMKQITVTAASGGAAADTPAALPRTGGDDAPIGLLAGALLLLAAGALTALRARRGRA